MATLASIHFVAQPGPAAEALGAVRLHAAGGADAAHAEASARKQGFKTIFVLSTRTTHWFIERGFAEADISRLPGRKQSLYNYERNSKIFIKGI